MQTGKSIVNKPLFICVGLSIAAHGALLYSRQSHTPAQQLQQSGNTVVLLTLIPSRASTPEPAPRELKTEPQELPEPRPEQPVPKQESIRPIETQQTNIPPVVQESSEHTPEPPPEEEITEAPPETAEQSSPEQLSTLVEDKGVITEAAPVAGIQTTYPRISRRRGEEGTVTLSIQVLKNGKAGSIHIQKSSGFKRLDDAAVEAARKSNYIPAQQFAKPIVSELVQPITFKLTENDN